VTYDFQPDDSIHSLSTRSRKPEAGSRKPEAGSWELEAGNWQLDIVHLFSA
jgi:hypothetical protein